MAEQAPEIAQVVPEATFIEDVAAFVGARPIDDVLRDVRETLERYNFVASQLGQRRQRLLIKEPEIKKCLDSVNLLITQRESGAESTTIDFSLADQVYAHAKVSNVDSVGLWLGAGVMVEYSLDEAKELLEKQLSSCRKQLTTVEGEMNYVRDQVTTTEVSLAHIMICEQDAQYAVNGPDGPRSMPKANTPSGLLYEKQPFIGSRQNMHFRPSADINNVYDGSSEFAPPVQQADVEYLPDIATVPEAAPTLTNTAFFPGPDYGAEVSETAFDATNPKSLDLEFTSPTFIASASINFPMVPLHLPAHGPPPPPTTTLLPLSDEIGNVIFSSFMHMSVVPTFAERDLEVRGDKNGGSDLMMTTAATTTTTTTCAVNIMTHTTNNAGYCFYDSDADEDVSEKQPLDSCGSSPPSPSPLSFQINNTNNPASPVAAAGLPPMTSTPINNGSGYNNDNEDDSQLTRSQRCTLVPPATALTTDAITSLGLLFKCEETNTDDQVRDTMVIVHEKGANGHDVTAKKNKAVAALHKTIRRPNTPPANIVYDTIDFGALKELFDLTVEEATVALGVSATSLKKACRRYHIKRWPQRLRKSLRVLRDELCEDDVAVDGMTADERVAAVNEIDALLESGKQQPSNFLMKIRQRMFKKKHVEKKKCCVC